MAIFCHGSFFFLARVSSVCKHFACTLHLACEISRFHNFRSHTLKTVTQAFIAATLSVRIRQTCRGTSRAVSGRHGSLTKATFLVCPQSLRSVEISCNLTDHFLVCTRRKKTSTCFYAYARVCTQMASGGNSLSLNEKRKKRCETIILFFNG